MLLFYSAASLIEIRKWNPQASGLAQPPGSGAEVQPLATLLRGLTPEVSFRLGKADPSPIIFGSYREVQPADVAMLL